MLSLNNLKKSAHSTYSSKRRGRGNASGRGNYSTRGMKGQRARSGGKAGLSSRSIRGYLLRIPKVRGFRSLYAKMAVVNLGDLEKNFESGATIKARDIMRLGLVANIKDGIKVLASGKLTKKFTIEAQAFSTAAEAQITKAGGQAKILSLKKPVIKEAAKSEESVK